MRLFNSIKQLSVILLAIILIGCSFFAPNEPTKEQKEALENPPTEKVVWINALVPKLLEWNKSQEMELLSQGRALTPFEAEIAQKMGVQNPGKIRVVVLDKLPFPEDPELAKELASFGLNSPDVGGLTLGYTILIKSKYTGKNWLLAHESVHVAQIERMGMEAFLRQYLLELSTVGYRFSSLEAEANRLMAQYQ